jgi:hypothetical protein
MADQHPRDDPADAARSLDMRWSVGILVVFVLLVALVAWLFTEANCVGDDTRAWPEMGSSRYDFCKDVDYQLAVLLAPLATFVLGVAAVRRRTWLLLIIGVGLGLIIAIAPWALVSDTSMDMP